MTTSALTPDGGLINGVEALSQGDTPAKMGPHVNAPIDIHPFENIRDRRR